MSASPVPVLQLFLLEAPPGGLELLEAGSPGLVRIALGVEIPLQDRAPEEVLSLCLRLGITARATRIAERLSSG